MTLRVRIAGLVALVVAVVVVVVGAMVHRTTEASLVSEVDDDLVERALVISRDRGFARRAFSAGQLEQLEALEGFGERSRDRFRVARNDPFGPVVGFDALVRVVDETGEIRGVLDTEFDASTDPELLAAAAQGPVLHDGSGDSGRVRVATVALGDVGFVQFARPLDEVDAVLDQLRTRTIFIGLVAIVGAGVVAWFLAGRTVRPIRSLTEATEYVTATGDLEYGVEAAAGTDEVGRLARSFRSMLDALAASRRQQRRLVMDASHELRTPLTSMRTNVDVLQRGHTLSEADRAAVIGDLDAELDELSELLAELVDLATDVRADEDLAPLTLAEVAEPVIERARRRTGREIRLEVADRVVVEGRPDALARAVRNLVDNAAKFSPPGTPIRVVVRGGELEVCDEGPGIPVEEREAVFDRFHRVEASRSLPGSGLGLAIVRQVAEAHDGDVFVRGASDGGAVVGFRVPTVDD